jgi:hypothetical protein
MRIELHDLPQRVERQISKLRVECASEHGLSSRRGHRAELSCLSVPSARPAIAVLYVALCARVYADGIVIAGGSPRAIGRAGTGTVSDDGAGALLLDPAVLARRDEYRAQIGVAFVDDNVQWLENQDAPLARDQAESRIVPTFAIEGGVGNWVLGIGAMTSATSERSLRQPGDLDPGHFGNAFDYRYDGYVGSTRRDTLAIGAARRLGDAVAVGISISASRVSVGETRSLWAGFIGRKDVLGDPAHDVTLAMTGVDDFSPSAVAGVLVAPPDTRVELAASIAWARTAHVDGPVVAVGSTDVSARTTASPTAHLDVPEPITVRTGARYLAEKWIVEVNGDLWIFPSSAESNAWQLDGVTVVDESSAAVNLTTLQSRLSERTHGAVRGAIDVQIIPGFLWATGGYAYTTANTDAAYRSTTFGDLSGHTVGLGLEATAGKFTFTLGWSRTWSIQRPEQISAWTLDNPFNAGNEQVPSGTFDESIDDVGVLVDAEY